MSKIKLFHQQLVAAREEKVSFLQGCGSFEITHASVDDYICVPTGSSNWTQWL